MQEYFDFSYEKSTLLGAKEKRSKTTTPQKKAILPPLRTTTIDYTPSIVSSSQYIVKTLIKYLTQLAEHIK